MKSDRKKKLYRLILREDTTHDIVYDVRFTKALFVTVAVLSVTIIISAVFCLVAFTPIKTLVPGYPDAQSRRVAVQNALKIDSLEVEVLQWEFYSENLKRIVRGEKPLSLDSLSFSKPEVSELTANADSVLGAYVREQERFEVASASRNLDIEGQYFFTPISGVITKGFDPVLHPYIDISAPVNTVVKSIYEGSVILSEWDADNGFTVAIQHKGDVISIYKHNEKLLKKVGDKVSAGTPVALVGSSNSGRGDHLRFELWYKGNAVDPALYINF